MSDYKHTEGSAVERMEQWIHLCECSNATGEATEIMEEAMDRIAQLEAENAALKKLLKVAACPSSCDSGTVCNKIGGGEWDLAQCRFCDERKQLAEETQRWIPVSERLPEFGEEVDLVIDGKRHVNWYLDHYSPTDHSIWWYSGKQASILDSPEAIPVKEATHWMPPPPTGEDDESK